MDINSSAGPAPNIKAILEALLFSSSEPLASGEVSQVLPGVGKSQIEEALQALAAEYEAQGRGVSLAVIANGYQFLTRPEYASYVKVLKKDRAERGLSQAAIETLAIIAYRQPATRADIEAIRGVNVGPILRTLVDRGLVRITGRAEVLGHPLLYGTTEKFLSAFGLASLAELPKMEEISK